MNKSIALALVCSILDASSAATQMAAPITSIAPTGQYAVGRRQVIWTDSARRDPSDSSRFREVAGWIWYPAAGASFGQESPLPPEWEALRLEALNKKLGPLVADAMKSFTVHQRTDAPLVADRSRFPVLLFVPGLSWLASDYSMLIDDLASHGYVVVGISPTGFSEPLKLPDGRVLPRSLGMGEKVATDQTYEQDDAQFALEKITGMNVAGFLEGRLDLSHIGAFGHSLGGMTSLVLADRDTLVRAAINIDGDAMGAARDARPRQPILLISSESPTMDQAPPNPSPQYVERMRDGLERSEKRRTDEWTAISSKSVSAQRIRIPGAYHLNFEDAALAATLLTDKQSRWMKFGSIEPERALTTLTSIVRSFFDQQFGRAAGGIPK